MVVAVDTYLEASTADSWLAGHNSMPLYQLLKQLRSGLFYWRADVDGLRRETNLYKKDIQQVP